MEASLRSNVRTSSGKTSQKSGGCYSSKRGTNSILMLMILEWDASRSANYMSLQCLQKVFIYLTRQVSSEQILIYNDGLPLTNAGPIVRHPTGLPITAGCDKTWIRTRDCSDESYAEMQCLRLLRHSYTLTYSTFCCYSLNSKWIQLIFAHPSTRDPL